MISAPVGRNVSSDNSEFRPGAVCNLPDGKPGVPVDGEVFDPKAEEVVKALTDQIMAQLSD